MKRTLLTTMFLLVPAVRAFAVPCLVTDSGPKFTRTDGDKHYFERHIDFMTGNVNYRLIVLGYSDQGKIFVSNIGLKSACPKYFSRPGWWGYGFAHLEYKGMDIFVNPVKILTGNGKATFTFQTSRGSVRILFTARNQSELLYMELDFEVESPDYVLKLSAYPGQMKKYQPKQRDRWIATALRRVRHGHASYKSSKPVFLGKNEPWVYYYDSLNNPGKNTWMRSCAMMYNPHEMAEARVLVGGYAIITVLKLKAVKKASLLLWEFPGQDTSRSLEYMRSLQPEFEPASATKE